MRRELKDLFLLAEDLLNEGSFSQAVSTYEQAFKISKKGSAEEFIALNYLGMLYSDVENSKNAIKYMKKAQSAAEKIFGKSSVEYATSLGNQAMVHSNANELWLAEPIFDEAVQILGQLKPGPRLTLDGFPSTDTVETYTNAGDCKARLGKLEDAILLFQNAYQAAKVGLPQAHSRRIQSAMELGILLTIVGRRREANKLQRETLAEVSGILPPHLALTALHEAITKAAGMMNAIEDTLARRGKLDKPSRKFKIAETESKQNAKLNKTTKNKSTVSNVVPLFSKSEQDQQKTDGSDMAYQLLVTLNHVSPPVWRRIVIPGDFTLNRLHMFIQKAMGWSNSHLHSFQVGKLEYGQQSQLDHGKNERNFTLASLKLKIGSKFTYIYDFGDYWEHSVLVERFLDENEFEASDFFIDAEGACPPEDCGGPPGFMSALEALKDPEFDPDDLPDWLQYFDPSELPLTYSEPGAKRKRNSSKKNSSKSSKEKSSSAKSLSERSSPKKPKST
jgi:tetratricopeptide (TPR) repeat protein